ncbi:hypothetical protein BTVI_115141 [Pitangus sulphuratus]|nr:hypothetical protein BTVI_115141 [Pitangus sulphuratus]
MGGDTSSASQSKSLGEAPVPFLPLGMGQHRSPSTISSSSSAAWEQDGIEQEQECEWATVLQKEEPLAARFPASVSFCKELLLLAQRVGAGEL